MALILSIDTALENAGVAIARDGNIIGSKTNNRQMDHAAWIHQAIGQLLNEASVTVNDLNAIAVTAGPGSYTGLRVGMATAKGLCYSLNIPLITENTLYLIAWAVKKNIKIGYSSPVVFSPMIDARRMEVFTTIFNENLIRLTEPSALILDHHAFKEELEKSTMVFCGNGSVKWQTICNHNNAVFSDIAYNVEDLSTIAAQKFAESDFTEIAYAEPFYLKNVYTGSK